MLIDAGDRDSAKLPPDLKVGGGVPAVVRLPASTLGVRLWRADLSLAPSPDQLECLSEQERRRAARFVFEADRRRYFASHVALREVLAAELSLRAADIEFVFGEHDKPALASRRDCVFNLSHSGEWALIGLLPAPVAGCEVGVDVEALRPVSDASQLASSHFTKAEQSELAACHEADRDRLFLQGWTRKEACLKAVGSGLSIAPDTFHCGLASVPQTTRIETALGWRRVDVETLAIGRDYLGAVALMRPESWQ